MAKSDGKSPRKPRRYNVGDHRVLREYDPGEGSGLDYNQIVVSRPFGTVAVDHVKRDANTEPKAHVVARLIRNVSGDDLDDLAIAAESFKNATLTLLNTAEETLTEIRKCREQTKVLLDKIEGRLEAVHG